jgi:hypothetical protein
MSWAQVSPAWAHGGCSFAPRMKLCLCPLTSAMAPSPGCLRSQATEADGDTEAEYSQAHWGHTEAA